MGVLDDAERLEPSSLVAWAGWLAEHHATERGVWLVKAKKATGRQAFGYEDSVVEALRFGWVDATHRPLDAERSMVWFAPRRPASAWSRPNKLRVARLEREGRMEDAGRTATRADRIARTAEATAQGLHTQPGARHPGGPAPG